MLKPWLLLPAPITHKLAPVVLKALTFKRPYKSLNWRSFKWKHLEFANPLGIAGGVDKDAEQIESWWSLGAGFIEVGTITPKSQCGNSGKVLDRSLSKKALWNRMGFPSKGW